MYVRNHQTRNEFDNSDQDEDDTKTDREIEKDRHYEFRTRPGLISMETQG